MNNSGYNEERVLHNLRHYLPAQAPLKDFIHHNTLHAFQGDKFHFGLQKASQMFGYKTYLCLDEYRQLFKEGKIHPEILNRVIEERKNSKTSGFWREQLLTTKFDTDLHSRIGNLRNEWKSLYRINLSKITHPLLLRIVGNYVDQGISISNFPVTDGGFLASIKDIERNSLLSFFRGQRARMFLFNSESCTIRKLLEYLVGDESLFEQYLFDQQFEHPGWSGMVSVLEENPTSLLDKRSISLRDFIFFELLLEIDALDTKFDENWMPLGARIVQRPNDLFSETTKSELFEVLAIWQEAYEWSYYDVVLTNIQKVSSINVSRLSTRKTFQGLFCIDDRDCSLRRYLERQDLDCETFATAGFFNVEFYYQPEGGNFYTKVCPAPVTPRFLIKEVNTTLKHRKDVHFQKQTHSLFGGWLSQTIGFWSAIKLFFNIFKPSLSASTTYSFLHMDKFAFLTIENNNKEDKVDGLQVGFTVEEMAERIEGLLKSIGLIKGFAPIVYIVGHGASSVNNTYYAGYDCGACAGRPGSANARVAANMANHKKVRTLLKVRGIEIPESTQFLGALQDTTRDEIVFFDEAILNPENATNHQLNKQTFLKALHNNAKERARRFATMNNQKSPKSIHETVRLRSVSLFEPRPEYNHATNAICIVGRRELSSHLFLDRRAFLNSFDYQVDPDGKYLLNILKAVTPVCGGINLEYYFSRVDNQKLGAGSKLPHNVVGLIGVANGSDGDLRTGLPLQMIEIHDPVRLLLLVEHFPEIIKKTLQQDKDTNEWFINEWIHLVAIHPETKAMYTYNDGDFSIYKPLSRLLKTDSNIESLIERESENIVPFVLK